MKRWPLMAALLSMLLTSATAEAKRSKREGFNFGLGLRVLDVNDDTNGEEDGKKNNSKKSAIQTAAPHVGYVFFDTINLGVSGLFDSTSTKEEFESKDGTQKITRNTDASTKGGSLFLRFLFADIMYFEAGAGIYNRKQKVIDEFRTQADDGSFTGEREEYSVKRAGPGYHLGAGLEIPAHNGFFFTANYLYRAVQYRDYSGSGSLGAKRARVETRELLFGLSHYVD